MKASSIRCLITAGPTREFFDPVRFLSNPSSGKMGYALAEAAFRRGWVVELVSGPVSLPPPEGVQFTQVVTGEQMFRAVEERFGRCDILIMTAAIMDYRPKEVAAQKIKKSDLTMTIEMEPVVDVLATVARSKAAHQLVVGFAAETENLESYALRKLSEKNADFMVGNLIGGELGAFGRDENSVLVLKRNGWKTTLGPESKKLLARQLLDLFEPSILGP